MKEVYVVKKNMDSIEGKGPMVLHSVWSMWESAHAFVMLQPGPMGTKQEFYSHMSSFIDGNWYYSSYGIHKVAFFESYNDYETRK